MSLLMFQDLEKLNLYSSPHPSNSPELKSRRMGQSRYRAIKIDELLDQVEANEKSTWKPKIVVTEDTPRKFFKSKGSVGSEETPVKLVCKAPRSVAKKPMSPLNNKSVKKSTKTSAYEIYEDDENSVMEQLSTKTPVRSRAARSTRKKNLDSAVKPGILDSSTTSTTRSTRKDAKRL